MLIFQFIKWVLIDIYRSFKEKDKEPHIYGIEGFFGLPGHGKTMSLVYRAEQYRKKYGDKIYIASNFGYKDEDFAITCWQDLQKDYDRSVIFLYDEIQNEFNSRDYKKFPVALLTLLTQNRKGKGKKILYTAQRYGRVDKVFRELTNISWNCHTFLGRLTICSGYNSQDYEEYVNQTNSVFRNKIKPMQKMSFVQDDRIRQCYDSFKQLESARSKEYMDRDEYNKVIEN
ncbi:MAG: hypothetical protein J6C17_00435 [Clostridia bacterium]|nr:hypothetical protein [Clostridia bacterium]